MADRRVLIAVGGGYGNIVMATPAIAAARSMADAVDVLVESHLPDAATLLAGWDVVDAVHLHRRSLRPSGCLYSAVVRARWSNGAPFHLAPEFVPDDVPPDAIHEAELNLTAVRRLGYEGPLPAPHVETETPLRSLPRRFIAVAPGHGGVKRSDWRRKAWPHWRAFCRRCREELGLDIVILGAERDRRRWMDTEDRLGLHNLCGCTSIRGAAGVIARSVQLIAIDNGLAHIGAALGRPTVVLFGATSEIKNRPLGADVRLVTADVDCRPCQMTPRWDVCNDWRCMREIAPDDVLAAMMSEAAA